MLHPSSELRYISPQIGYGVFATAFIPKGTIVWLTDPFDRVLTPAEARKLPDLMRAKVERYAYIDADGNHVLCWDFGRYMNHACAPTGRFVGYGLEIAVRDIQPDEQLTCEYGLLNIRQDFACRCGAPACRGQVAPEDIDRFEEAWDREAEEAFRCGFGVAQPLLPCGLLNAVDLEIAAALQEGRMIPLPGSRAFLAPAFATTARARAGNGLWAI